MLIVGGRRDSNNILQFWEYFGGILSAYCRQQKEMTGNEVKRDATKVPDLIQTVDISVHGQRLKA